MVGFMGLKFPRTFYRFRFPLVSKSHCGACIPRCSTVYLKYSQLTTFVWVCIWALYSVLLTCLFFHQYHSLCDCSFIVSREVRLSQSSEILLFQYCVYNSESFAFPYKLCNQADIHTITSWDFDWDYVESFEQLGRTNILAKLSSQYECGILSMMEYLSIYIDLLLFLS